MKVNNIIEVDLKEIRTAIQTPKQTPTQTAPKRGSKKEGDHKQVENSTSIAPQEKFKNIAELHHLFAGEPIKLVARVAKMIEMVKEIEELIKKDESKGEGKTPFSPSIGSSSTASTRAPRLPQEQLLLLVIPLKKLGQMIRELPEAAEFDCLPAQMKKLTPQDFKLFKDLFDRDTLLPLLFYFRELRGDLAHKIGPIKLDIPEIRKNLMTVDEALATDKRIENSQFVIFT